MLDHPHIVKFLDCFEDGENIYMLLELCEGGVSFRLSSLLIQLPLTCWQSLMRLLRKRKRLTEPEARILLVQIIAACQYMHQTNVIHRDLKLGNIFLSKNLSVKVGDLGLAALIERPGDRKKCVVLGRTLNTELTGFRSQDDLRNTQLYRARGTIRHHKRT